MFARLIEATDARGSQGGLKPDVSPFFAKIAENSARDALRQPTEVLMLIYRGPWLRRDSRIRPEGRATGSRAFFDSTRMYCRKTRRSPRTRRNAPGATDGVCFLLVTFSFHKKRKVTRSRQRAKPKAERKSSTIAAVESINSRSLADGSG